MKKSYSSREIIKILEQNGWYLVKTEGDHWHFKHNQIKGKVTVTHPVKDVKKQVLKGIELQSGLKF